MAGQLEYTLFDSMGKDVYKIQAENPIFELNIYSYPAGLYYLLVTDEKISVVYKLFFEK